MPTVYVPGVAHSVLSGKIGSNPWAIQHHWKFGSSTAPWVQSDTDLLASTIFSAYQSHIFAHSYANVSISQVSVVDLTSASGVGSVYAPAPVSGAISGTLEPSSVAIVVQNKIASRYRGGHPRTFYPGPGIADMVNEYQFNSGILPLWSGYVTAFVTQVLTASYVAGSSSLTHVTPRYTYIYTDVPGKHKYTKEKSGLLGVFVVQGYVANQRVGSMRRRLSP
jgi:hypothetical protein